jgi:hypothetical protein
MPSRKGSPNKNKAFLLKRLQDMYGDDFDPIIRMSDHAIKMSAIASEDGSMDNHKTALDGWDKVAQYVQPKLKAVEVSGDPDAPVEIKRVVEFVRPAESDNPDA